MQRFPASGDETADFLMFRYRKRSVRYKTY